MQKIEFKRIKNEFQTWSIFYKNNIFPYSVKYIWKEEEEVFLVKIPGFEQEFLEEDLQDFFNKTVYTWLEDFLQESQKQEKLKTLTCRIFESDFEFLKKYASKNGVKYQALMRDFIHKWVLELKAED